MMVTQWKYFLSLSVLLIGVASGQSTFFGPKTFKSGTVTFQDTVDQQGAVLVSGSVSPSQITSDQDDYSPTGLSESSIVRLSSDASRTLTGMNAQSDAVKHLINVGSNDIVIAHDSSSSVAANRFYCAGGTDMTIEAGHACMVWYDDASSRWRSTGSTSSSGGGGGSGDMVASTYDPAGIEEQLVGLTAAQTLTNKTLDGDLNTIQDLASSSFKDADWGEISVASGVVTIDSSVILPVNFADADWGDISLSGGVATVDPTLFTDPAGADSQLQFNDSGAFGATSSLRWRDSTYLNIDGDVALTWGSTAREMGLRLSVGGTHFLGMTMTPSTRILTIDSKSSDATGVVIRTGAGPSEVARATINGFHVGTSVTQSPSTTYPFMVNGNIATTWGGEHFIGAYTSTTHQIGMVSNSTSRTLDLMSKGTDGNPAVVFLTGATPTEQARIGNSGMYMAGATGGGQGVGTINATGFYLNGVSFGSPGGDNTQVQFNSSGSFGGSSAFTWDGTDLTVTRLVTEPGQLYSEAVGDLAGVSSSRAAAFGFNAQASQAAVAIGTNADAFQDSIAIGSEATTTARGQVMFDFYSYQPQFYYLGGRGRTSPLTTTLYGTANTTTNGNGAALALQGGAPDGTGSYGNLILQPDGGVVSIASAFTLPNTDGSANQVLQTDGSGTVSWSTVSASPGGADTQVQFNNAGAFGGSADLTWDGTEFTVDGNIDIDWNTDEHQVGMNYSAPGYFLGMKMNPLTRTLYIDAQALDHSAETIFRVGSSLPEAARVMQYGIHVGASVGGTQPTATIPLVVNGDISTTWGTNSFIGEYHSASYELGIQMDTVGRDLHLIAKSADGVPRIEFLTGSVPTERGYIGDDEMGLIVPLNVTLATASYTAATFKSNDNNSTNPILSVTGTGLGPWFTVHAGGVVSFGGVSFPTTDGSADQVLVTDGSGNLTWQDQSGGSTPAVTALNNQAESRLVTIGATTTELDGETRLTFDGDTFIGIGDPAVAVPFQFRPNDGDLTNPVFAVQNQSAYERFTVDSNGYTHVDHAALAIGDRAVWVSRGDQTTHGVGLVPYIYDIYTVAVELDHGTSDRIWLASGNDESLRIRKGDPANWATNPGLNIHMRTFAGRPMNIFTPQDGNTATDFRFQGSHNNGDHDGYFIYQCSTSGGMCIGPNYNVVPSQSYFRIFQDFDTKIGLRLGTSVASPANPDLQIDNASYAGTIKAWGDTGTVQADHFGVNVDVTDLAMEINDITSATYSSMAISGSEAGTLAIGQVHNPRVYIAGYATAGITLDDYQTTTNQQLSEIYYDGGTLYFKALNDDRTDNNTWMRMYASDGRIDFNTDAAEIIRITSAGAINFPSHSSSSDNGFSWTNGCNIWMEGTGSNLFIQNTYGAFVEFNNDHIKANGYVNDANNVVTMGYNTYSDGGWKNLNDVQKGAFHYYSPGTLYFYFASTGASPTVSHVYSVSDTFHGYTWNSSSGNYNFKLNSENETAAFQMDADADDATSQVLFEFENNYMVDNTLVKIESNSNDIAGSPEMLYLRHYSSATDLNNLASGYQQRMEFFRYPSHTTGTVTTDIDALYVFRDDRQLGSGGTHTATGSVLRLENVAHTTAGTLNDSVAVIELVQDADSTGDMINAKYGSTEKFVVDQDGNVEMYSDWLKLPVHTDGTRGAAGTAGRVIFNSTDGQLNIDDGTNWTLPDGTTT